MTLKEFPNQTTTLITGGSGTLGNEKRKTNPRSRKGGKEYGKSI